MELADIQAAENEGHVSGAEIPVETASPEAPASEKPLSLRDQIVQNVEKVRTEEAKRVRDAATGKFVPSDKAEEKPAAETPKPEQNAQATESKPVGPPSGWSKEAQAVWDQLPPAVRADAVRREAEVAKGFDEYRSKTAQLSEISQALEPLKPILQQSGIQTEAQAVKRLLEWEGSFRNPQTRMAAFQNLAQQYGVDLSTLVQNPSHAPSSVQDIPEPLRPVVDQFGNVVNDLNSVKQEIQNLRNERVENDLRSFAKDKPHFDKVRGIMGQLMQSGLANDLGEAYQKATTLHPEVSAQIKADEDAKHAAEQEKIRAEKAKTARLAAVSPSGRSPNGAPAASAQSGKAKSTRESILAAIKEAREGQRA